MPPPLALRRLVAQAGATLRGGWHDIPPLARRIVIPWRQAATRMTASLLRRGRR